jgi:hypothetical protein
LRPDKAENGRKPEHDLIHRVTGHPGAAPATT